MIESGLAVENINKRYGKKQILQDVSFSIPKGTVFGLLGPSGCGKSTTVKIMAGILKADSGTSYVLGKPMPDLDLMAKVGYMAQATALYPQLSAYQNLKFFGSLFGLKKKELEERISYAAGLVNLQDRLKSKVADFSEGMKQRLSLGAALIANPQVLILDEPTVGIDPLLRKSIWEELHELAEAGTTILITTHVMDEAEKCDTLAMMRQGKIIAMGTPDEILRQADAGSVEEAFIHFGRAAE